MCEISCEPCEASCEIDIVVNIITKLYIIINATKLGWNVEIIDNGIILSKKINKLTKLDKSTPKLLNALISN